ncbi:TetR/AcrR family transcriptional regulator [Streptomyces sp. NBC_01294]|uniref:TetR/AcrR family transcriptional regulator n=1 Tax=Streptomyces sp. NBC_01294 TaxID=2903815 RepID=UPI002DD97CAC|nr:TetR family transcriptional regulator [Streptomyces sp. NBC_01294]WRZ55887.1 TetR family transcriptional regulator [Streptomyces sp. NBC_01294]
MTAAATPGGPTPKGHQRRTALLDAAERILGSSGGAELTMRAVADAAGVRLGHLQYYFPARSDLLAALLDRILTASLARVAALTDASGADAGAGAGADADAGAGADTNADADAGAEAILDTVLGDHDDLPLVRLFTEVWSMAAHDEEAARAVRAFYAAYAGHVAEFIRGRSPALTPAAAAARAEVFVMLMEGSALFRSGITGRPTTPADTLLRRTLLGLLAGEALPSRHHTEGGSPVTGGTPVG